MATFRTQAAAGVPQWDELPPAPAEPSVRLPEPRVSKQTFAVLTGMSVRWVEQKIAAGMPCEYIDGRPRIVPSAGEAWLRERGHLKGTPTPRRGGRKVADRG